MLKYLIFFLMFFSIFGGLFLASYKSFFGFMFLLVYVGAILVLLLYIFSSQIMKKMKTLFSMFLLFSFSLMFFFFFFCNIFNKLQKKDLKDFLFKNSELWLVLFLCIFIILVLFCLLKLDMFRFSSLRSKV